MTPQDIDQVRIIAEHVRRRNIEEGTRYAVTQDEANRRANLRFLAAKCGEYLARTLYGIAVRQHTRED